MAKIRVEVKKSRIHGKGLFAAEKIPKGTWIIRYAGQKVSRREGARRDRFYASIGYTALFDAEDHYIDGVVGGNESIYINHSKRKPNVEALIRRGGVWFQALRDIADGEELTFDYGFDPKSLKTRV